MSKPLHQTELHKKKLKKNLMVLGLIIGFIAMIWCITIIRIAGGA